MKMKKLSVPISMTATLAFIVACALSCAKKNTVVENPQPAPPEPHPANSAAANSRQPATAATDGKDAAHAMAITNLPGTMTTSPEITNLPPAETAAKPAENNAATVTSTNITIIEMPTTLPAAPTNFYSADFISNSACCVASDTTVGTNFFFRFRAGYQHINHGDNNDSYWLSAKFYAYGDDQREGAGKSGWLIPDADAEISSQYLPKSDRNPSPGSGAGLRLRADFSWPWIHWTTRIFARTNSICPFCQPLALAFGPTVNVGFDHLYEESVFHFAGYAGVRLTFNRSGFIEYTAGSTRGLNGTRQQVVTEIPFYESRDGEVRYYLRGLWNRGASNRPDVLEGGLFLEMPFGTLTHPDKWGDLVPFLK